MRHFLSVCLSVQVGYTHNEKRASQNSPGSALVHQLSYVHWWTSYYLNKDSWYTTNQGRSHHFEILPNEHRNHYSTSYLYFNNSWSTNENMITGRPWLILNCRKGCLFVYILSHVCESRGGLYVNVKLHFLNYLVIHTKLLPADF